MLPQVEVRMIWRKAGQLREDTVTVTFIEDFCLKVERAQPRTDATSLDGDLLTGEEQTPAKPLSSKLRRHP